MGRTGTCADDAGMESFFSLLQKNVLNQKRWACREELRLAIVNWIRGHVHRRRRQRGLPKRDPSLLRQPTSLPSNSQVFMSPFPLTTTIPRSSRA